jgi:lambda family phage holin
MQKQPRDSTMLENFESLPTWLGGILMAIFMSALRVIYDKDETSVYRILMESLICGGLTLAAGSGFDAMGYGPGWYLFCGGMIGFTGSQFIRAAAKKLVIKKVS